MPETDGSRIQRDRGQISSKGLGIEKRGEQVVLKPLTPPKFKSFTEIARHLAEKFPDACDFPKPPPCPSRHDRPILGF